MWRQEKFSKGQAFIDLLIRANYKPLKGCVDGRYVVIPRGTVLTSMVALAEEWRWNRRTVERFLRALEMDGTIHIETRTKCTLISIVNYDTYQSGEEGVRAPKCASNAHQTRTCKEVKNITTTLSLIEGGAHTTVCETPHQEAPKPEPDPQPVPPEPPPSEPVVQLYDTQEKQVRDQVERLCGVFDDLAKGFRDDEARAQVFDETIRVYSAHKRSQKQFSPHHSDADRMCKWAVGQAVTNVTNMRVNRRRLQFAQRQPSSGGGHTHHEKPLSATQYKREVENALLHEILGDWTVESVGIESGNEWEVC